MRAHVAAYKGWYVFGWVWLGLLVQAVIHV